MRYELTDYEWAAIRPMLPNKARGTTCYNRFVRWRRAGVWGRIMHALAAAHDAAVQIIDTSIVRVHQRAATRYDKLAANERPAAPRPLQGGPHLDQSGSQRRAERAAGAGTARAKGEEDGRTGFDTRRGQRWERGSKRDQIAAGGAAVVVSRVSLVSEYSDSIKFSHACVYVFLNYLSSKDLRNVRARESCCCKFNGIWIFRESAGTRSAAARRTISPGTISTAGISTGCPSRSALAESETCSRRRSAAISARCSCTTSRITDMSTMTVIMTKLGTSPVNADTAAANSRTKTNGLRNRPIKAASRRLGAAESMRFGPTVARIAAASDVLRPVSVECSSCRRSVRGRTARSDVPGAACSVAPLAWRCVAGSGAVTLGETEAVDLSGHARRERDKNKMR